ncbi:hypothetical protein HYZ97_01330 [Candidatus Pacearchaeota archaeon]|nr:hypothetical protein [Candidatus Pacearchaeota archaeon]
MDLHPLRKTLQTGRDALTAVLGSDEVHIHAYHTPDYPLVTGSEWIPLLGPIMHFRRMHQYQTQGTIRADRRLRGRDALVAQSYLCIQGIITGCFFAGAASGLMALVR